MEIMMVARTKKADTAAPDANPEPAKTRKPRTPKPVTDVATASAAFNRAKKTADKAEAELVQAQENAAAARAVLAESGRVLKGFLGEVDAAVNAVVPQTENDAQDAEDAPYEGDGYGDTAHTA